MGNAVGHDEVRHGFAANGDHRGGTGSAARFPFQEHPRQHRFRVPERLQMSGRFAQRVLDKSQGAHRLLLVVRHDQVIDPVEQQRARLRQHPLAQTTGKAVALGERFEGIENETLRLIAERPIKPAFLPGGFSGAHESPR